MLGRSSNLKPTPTPKPNPTPNPKPNPNQVLARSLGRPLRVWGMAAMRSRGCLVRRAYALTLTLSLSLRLSLTLTLTLTPTRWDQMWRATTNYGRKGLPLQAISQPNPNPDPNPTLTLPLPLPLTL